MNRIGSWGICVIIILFSTLSLGATDYFVDSRQGRDSNSGRSTPQAWRTIEKVNQFKFQPGDRIFLKCGSTWRESLLPQSGEPGKPITYSSYGEGAKPRLIRSINLQNPKIWIPAGKNLWKTPSNSFSVGELSDDTMKGNWSVYCDGNGRAKLKFDKDTAGNLKLNLTCIHRGDKNSNIQLSLNRFQVQSKQSFVFRFRAKSSIPFDFTNVSMIKSGFPWTSYGTASFSSSRIVQQWKDFEILFVSNHTADDCRVTFFLGTDIPEGAVLEIIPLETRSATVSSTGLSADVGNVILIQSGKSDKTAGVKRWSKESLNAQADYWFNLSDGDLWFYCDKNPGQKYSYIEAALKYNLIQAGNQHDFVIDGIEFSNSAAHGMGGPNIRNATIRNCEFNWIGGGHLYTKPGQQPTRYGNGIEFWCACENNLVENNLFTEIYDTAMTNQGPDKCLVKNIVWRGNTVRRCEQAYEVWFSSKETKVEGVVYQNNQSFDCGYGWGHAQRPNKNACHLLSYSLEPSKLDITYRNNRFVNSANYMIWFFNSRLSEVNIDQNTYSQTGEKPIEQPLFRWKGVDGVSFESYRRQTGQDKQSRFE